MYKMLRARTHQSAHMQLGRARHPTASYHIPSSMRSVRREARQGEGVLCTLQRTAVNELTRRVRCSYESERRHRLHRVARLADQTIRDRRAQRNSCPSATRRRRRRRRDRAPWLVRWAMPAVSWRQLHGDNLRLAAGDNLRLAAGPGHWPPRAPMRADIADIADTSGLMWSILVLPSSILWAARA